jgi:hypothetical protein
MSWLLVLLLVVHGSLHLLGFLKPWGFAEVPALSGRSWISLSDRGAHIVGILWLIACLLFWLAAGFRIARHESWWIAGAAGVLLSQGLVVFQWADAKAGTVPNLLIWVAVVIAAATARFELRVDDEIGALVARAAQSTNAWVARPENLERTPAPVQRWLKRSGALDKERPNTVRLLQRGAIRTSPDGAWMPAEAEQYFSVNPPGFVWRVKTTMG